MHVRLIPPILLAAVTSFVGQSAFGQSKTGTSTGTTSATDKSGSSTGYLGPNDSLPTGFQPKPQFVNGKVVLDDGTPAPDNVVIERVCNGIAHTEGFTDKKGAFGMELGHDQLVQDASDMSGAVKNPNTLPTGGDHAADPNRPYRECEIRASLPGYRSDTLSLATFRPGENSNLGTIILHKMGDVEGHVVSATAAAAPKNAVKEFDKATEALKKGKTDDARKSYTRAAALYPEYAAAWFELGKLQLSAGELDGARGSFQAAIKAEPKFISPYLQLTQLDFRTKNWRELSDVTDQVIKLDAFDYPEAFFLNGVANYSLKQMDVAEKSFRGAEKIDTSHRYPKTHEFLAGLLAQKNDLGGAAEELRNYLKYAPDAPDAEAMRRQLAQVERAARK